MRSASSTASPRPTSWTTTTLKLAQTIAAKDPAAIRLGKRAFQAQLGQPLPEAYRIAGEIMVENVLLPDTAEGIQRFLDRR